MYGGLLPQSGCVLTVVKCLGWGGGGKQIHYVSPRSIITDRSAPLNIIPLTGGGIEPRLKTSAVPARVCPPGGAEETGELHCGGCGEPAERPLVHDP